MRSFLRSRHVYAALTSFVSWVCCLCALTVPEARAASSLESWDQRGAGLTSQAINDVVYTGERFVAVGGSGQVLGSPDGVAWSLVETGFSATFNGVAFGAGTLVAVGAVQYGQPAVAFSEDGLTWTMSSTMPTVYTSLRRVTYGAGRFVAVGTSGAIMTSTDGETWTSATSPTSLNLYDVQFANGYFVAAAAWGKLLYSADGVSWQLRNTSTTDSFTALAYSSGQWFAVASSSGGIWTSTDGLTWTQASSTGDSTIGVWDLHANAGGQLVGVALDEVVHAGASLEWTAVGVTGDSDIWLNAIAEGNGTLVVVGGAGALYQSGDPAVVAPSISSLEGLDAVPVNEEVTLAIAGNGAATVELWVDGVKAGEASGDATTIAWTPTRIGPHTLVLRGIQPSDETISSDAVTALVVPVFTQRMQGTSGITLGDVTYTGELFVAVGNGQILVSPDGVAWSERLFTQNSMTFRATASGGGAIVAVGQGYFNPASGQPSGAAVYSTDGVTWQLATVPAGIYQFTSVAYGGGRFVAVGAYGKIAVSTNGKTWNEVVSGTSDWLYEVRYGGGRFVTVGSSGAILRSADGLSWSARTVGPSDPLESLAYYNNEWVATGYFFGVWTSPDGAVWEQRRSGGSQSGPSRLLAASDGFLYGVGATGLYFSESPESWSFVSFDPATPTMSGLVDGNDTLVVVGTSRTILQTGNPRVIAPSFADVVEDDVFTLGEDIALGISQGTGTTTELLVDGVAVASASGDAGTISWTPTQFGSHELSLRGTNADGEVSESQPVQVEVGLGSWTWRHRKPFGGDLTGAAYAFGKWWVIGTGRVLMSSADSIDWTISGPERGASFTGIAASSTRLVITTTGYDYTWGGVRGSILTSADGLTWSVAEGAVATSANGMNAVAYSGGRWVAVGNAGVIGTSDDGLTWVQRSSPANENLVAVASNGSASAPLWVAIGSGGSILGSTDGATWTVRHSIGTFGLNEIAHCAGRWVVVGWNGIMLTSENGSTWTSRPAPSSGSFDAIGVVNNAFVATGTYGTIYRSVDGLAWTALTPESFNRYGYSAIIGASVGGLIVGQGGDIMHSSDGLNWSRRSSGPGNILRAMLSTGSQQIFAGTSIDYLVGSAMVGSTTAAASPILADSSVENIAISSLRVPTYTWEAGNEFYGLCEGGGVYCAVGNGGAIVTSTDGSRWITRNSGVSSSLYAATYRRGVFVAVGADGCVLTSKDGVSWTARTSGVTTALNSVAASLRTYVAVGDNGAILSSADGVTWTKRSSGTTDSVAQIAWHPRHGFVAIGNFNLVLTSADGVSWEKQTSYGPARAVVATPAGFVANSSSDGQIYTSRDGRSWSASFFPSGGINGFAMAGNELIAFGNVGKILSHPLPEADLRITGQPQSHWLKPGQAATLSVTATGSGDLTYQWFKDGAPIVGATSASYVVGSAVIAHSGFYAVSITNTAGDVVVSDDARLAVEEPVPPSITKAPDAVTLYRTETATFSVTATGSGLLAYQWSKDGTPIAGATADTFMIDRVTMADAGTYTVTVSNDDGSVSRSALLTVNEPPVPSVIVSSQSSTFYPGQSVSMFVVVSGLSPFTYQWSKHGQPIAGATSTAYSFNGVSAADADAYSVAVTDRLGSTTTSSVQLSVLPAPGITARDSDPVVNLGGTITLDLESIEGGVSSAQWYKDGVAIAGATETSLTLTGVTSADAGAYSVVVTNSLGSTTSQALDLIVNVIRLSNLSIRARSGAGDRVLIAGLVMEGSIHKPVLLRGVGPSLTDFGVTSPLEDPSITLFRRVGETSEVIATNDNWSTAANLAEVTAASARLHAFDLPGTSLDAVLLPELGGGVYTAHVAGKDGTEGVALTEVYDGNLDEERSRLVNISARCQVGVHEDVLIAGFVVSGPGSVRLLIRGVGPTLKDFGVTGELTDPAIALHRMLPVGSEVLASANDWSAESNAAEIKSVAERVHAFELPSGSKDAAMLVSLSEGVYTVVMSGVNETTGVGLIEVYVVP